MPNDKKYKVKQDVLSDFAATVDANPNLSQAELFKKFPEFNNDPDFLQSAVDYHATSKSGKYKTVDELNSKFPEFEFDGLKKKVGTSESSGELSFSASTETPKSTPEPPVKPSPKGMLGFGGSLEEGAYKSQVGETQPVQKTTTTPVVGLSPKKAVETEKFLEKKKEEEKPQNILNTIKEDVSKMASMGVFNTGDLLREDAKLGKYDNYLDDQQKEELGFVNNIQSLEAKLKLDPTNEVLKQELEKNDSEYKIYTTQKNAKIDEQIAELEKFNESPILADWQKRDNTKKIQTLQAQKEGFFKDKVEAAFVQNKSEMDEMKIEGKTPKEKMVNYFLVLDKKSKQLQEQLYPNGVLDVTRMALPFGMTDYEVSKKAELDEVESTLKQLAPIVLINRSPLKTDEGFFSSAVKKAVNVAIPNTEQAVLTEQQRANLLNVAVTQAGIKPNEVSDIVSGNITAKIDSTKPYSANWWGELTGSSAGMIPSFAAGGKLVSSIPAITRMSKVLGTTKFGKYIATATEEGLAYKGAGYLSPDDSSVDEESSFMSGYLGSTIGQGFGASKLAVAAFNKLFGKNASAAKDIVASLGNRVASGAGEYGEEFGNTVGQLVTEYQKTGDWEQLKSDFNDQFGTMSKNLEFFVSTFTMGLVMGGATALGRASSAKAKDQYDAMSDEEKKQADAYMESVANDIKESTVETVKEEVKKGAEPPENKPVTPEQAQAVAEAKQVILNENSTPAEVLNATKVIQQVEAQAKETEVAQAVESETVVTEDAKIAENTAKVNTPTKESVIEMLNINNPFYKKVEEALVKLGLIEKYNPETKVGDVVGGYVQPDGQGGFASGDMYFKSNGSISYVTSKGIVEFDKNGNVISENTEQVAQETKKSEIEGRKQSILSLEKIRDSEAFKYKEVTETDILGNKKKIKRLKTPQELKESTDKINASISEAKLKLSELDPSIKENPITTEDGKKSKGKSDQEGLLTKEEKTGVAEVTPSETTIQKSIKEDGTNTIKPVERLNQEEEQGRDRSGEINGIATNILERVRESVKETFGSISTGKANKDIPVVEQRDVKEGDKVSATIYGKKVDGIVLGVGEHKGQIVIDIIQPNGDKRFIYGRQIDNIEKGAIQLPKSDRSGEINKTTTQQNESTNQTTTGKAKSSVPKPIKSVKETPSTEVAKEEAVKPVKVKLSTFKQGDTVVRKVKGKDETWKIVNAKTMEMKNTKTNKVEKFNPNSTSFTQVVVGQDKVKGLGRGRVKAADRQVKDPYLKNAINSEAFTAKEFVLKHFAEGGRVSFKAMEQLGITGKEAQSRMSYKGDDKVKNENTLDAVTHSIYENIPEELGIDIQDVRDEVETAIMDHNNPVSMAKELDRIQGGNVKKAEDAKKGIVDDMEANAISSEKSVTPEESNAIANIIDNMTDEQFDEAVKGNIEEDWLDGIESEVGPTPWDVEEKAIVEKVKDGLRALKVDNKNKLNAFGLLPETWNTLLDATILSIETVEDVSKAIGTLIKKAKAISKDFQEKEFIAKMNEIYEIDYKPEAEVKVETESTKDEKSPKERKKSVLNRAYEGVTNKGLKYAIEKHGLTYLVENQIEAEKAATDFINEVGMQNALDAVRKGQVTGAPAASIWAQAIDSVGRDLAQATDPSDIQELQDVEAELLEEFGIQAKKGGQFNSMINRIYAMSEFGYKASTQIEVYKRNNGGEIPADIEQKFKDLEKELDAIKSEMKEAEKRALEAERELEIKNIQESIAREKKEKTNVKEQTKKIANRIRGGKINRPSMFLSSTPGAIAWDAAVEITARSVEATGVVADAIQKGLAYIKSTEWYKGLDSYKQKEAEKQFTEFVNDKGKVETGATVIDGKIKIPHSLIRQKVEEGITNPDDLTKSIHDDLKDEYPDITERQVRDAISNYGRIINPNMEEIEVQIRKIKRIDRITSALEDIAKNKRPLKSGQQREKIDAEERSLNKQLKEALKLLPIDSETEANQLKTSLDAVKARLKNSIEDMERQIATGEKAAKAKGIPYDEEAKALMAERDRIRKIRDDIFGDSGISDEQKIDNAKKAAERAIAETERRIAENELEVKKNKKLTSPELEALREALNRNKAVLNQMREDAGIPQRKRLENAKKAAERAIAETERRIAEKDLEVKKNKKVTSPELEALREALNRNKSVLNQMREDAGIPQRKRLENAKKAAERQIKILQTKIKDKDFSKRKSNPVIADTELLNLRAEKLRIQEEFNKIQYQNELKNRSKWQKLADGLWEVWGLTRALRATGEFSFVALQGSINLAAHPISSAKAFKNAIIHFASEKKADKFLRHLQAQEFYPRMKESKLAITENDAKLNAREELFLSGWVNHIWDIVGLPIKLINKNAYELWKKFNLTKMFERASTGYMNTLRVDRYLQGEQMLERQGKTFAGNPKDYKDMADVINTFTGRSSLGKMEMISKPLSTVFFSPRMWASTIKQTTPYAFIWLGRKHSKGDPWYKPSVAQKMALGDYMKYVALTGSIVMLAKSFGDDDEKDGVSVNMDPNNSDFMKIKVGNTRIDPWGGRIQMIVLQARFINDVTVQKGETKKLGSSIYTPTKYDLMMQLAQNKFAPSAAMVYKYMSSHINKEGERVSKFGEPIGGPLSMTTDNLYPIYWETIKEINKEQPETVARFFETIAFFGVGVNTYQSKDKK